LEIGYNYRLTNIQAAIGVAQLEHFEEAVRAKVEIARQYNDALQNIPGLTLPPEAGWAKNVYWVYGVIVNENFGMPRSRLQRLLWESGIETRRFFEPVHKQPILEERGDDGEYPHSNYLSENGFYLPSYIGMTPDTISIVADLIRSLHGKRHD
jgi:perosamine synthetase